VSTTDWEGGWVTVYGPRRTWRNKTFAGIKRVQKKGDEGKEFKTLHDIISLRTPAVDGKRTLSAKGYNLGKPEGTA